LNALDHAGPDVTVEVGALQRGFYVADDGTGVPPDEDVFAPGVSTDPDGTGMGLASVRQIVRAHDWEIDVTDSESGGARFEVTGIETVHTSVDTIR
jgi:signal transduction histidine kinase